MVKANILKGMKEIAQYIRCSEPTVLKYKRDYPGMPINKVRGEWIGKPSSLEQFLQDIAEGISEKWLS